MLQLNVYKNNDANSEQYGKAYARAELNKVATLGWTTKAQDLINADKEAMAQAAGGNG